MVVCAYTYSRGFYSLLTGMFAYTSHKATSHSRNKIFKYLTVFFLGFSGIALLTQGFNITTNLDNAVQYINKIVLTSDGSNQWATGIVLDGTNNSLAIGNILWIWAGLTGYFPCWLANSCGIALHSRDVYSLWGDFSIIGGDFWIGYDVGNSSSNNNLYISGNVGIGTNTPAQKLEVAWNIKLSTGGWIGATGTNQLFLWANGNVGIGINNPTEKLSVSGYAWIGNNNNDLQSTWGTFLRLAWGHENTNAAYDTSILSNNQPNIQLHYNFYSHNMWWWWYTDNYYDRKVDGGTSFGISFATWAYNYDSKLTILPNGMVGIGTTSPSQKLEVAGNVAAAGFFYTSDRRYKENISVITDPLQKITQLSGYTFTWKNSGRADIGVIAQEVESVFPQAVSTNTQWYKSVEYGNLVAPVIEAIKALYYKYVDQEARITKLEQELKVMQSSLHQ